jgi:hypothetical protein
LEQCHDTTLMPVTIRARSATGRRARPGARYSGLPPRSPTYRSNVTHPTRLAKVSFHSQRTFHLHTTYIIHIKRSSKEQRVVKVNTGDSTIWCIFRAVVRCSPWPLHHCGKGSRALTASRARRHFTGKEPVYQSQEILVGHVQVAEKGKKCWGAKIRWQKPPTLPFFHR